MISCEIDVVSTSPGDRDGEPITIGIPLPSGWCRDTSSLSLIGPDHEPVALQAAALNRWIDGSIRWVLLDFLAVCRAQSRATYELVSDMPRATAAVGDLHISKHAGAVVVDTGPARFVVRPGDTFPFEDVQVGNDHPIDCRRTRVVVTQSDGRISPLVVSRAVVEERGPIRGCVRLEGVFGDGHSRIDLLARLTFWSGKPAVQMALTLRNSHAADHPGGYWQLGSRGAIHLKDVSLVLGLATGQQPPTVNCSTEAGLAPLSVDLPFELHQESSGGERWNSSNHVDRSGRVTTSFRGYRLNSGASQSAGLRASPIVNVSWGQSDVSVAVSKFWQNFPRSIEATSDELTVRLFPRQSAPHELQGGEQKTHVLTIAVGRDPTSRPGLAWVHQPLMARASPEWYAGSGAVSYLVPESADPNAHYLALIRTAVEGPSSFSAKREVIDEYGWRHFGDLYADHEAVGHGGPNPLISHYNNQYDAIAGFAVHFMRSGDPRWWDLLQDLAAHVVDIDIYHTTHDKSAYNGGLFWHTYHYVDAGTSTHRSYPRSPGVPGGGPSNEHDYSTGLLLQYFLTGDSRYRDAVIGLARWVLNRDDGRQTIFRWLDQGPTGLASQTSSPDYHGPGRGVAYSIDTLLNAHRLTDEPVFLDGAEGLIRRSVHPRQDLAALNLPDVERRWHYTVCLQTLGRFLDYKCERGELGFMYAYARESLLHYARWMAKHEYPYLEKPELLEYPTETWAAQDLRKSEVFMHAARHASADERHAFLEKAEFFFRNSIATLMRMDSRALTRPMVLLLTNGYMRSWFLRHESDRTPPPHHEVRDFGSQKVFVSQKVRARRRAVVLAGLAGLVAVLSALAATFR